MINQHHFNRYMKFINYFKLHPTEGFCEKHHIIPKCMGGTNDPENLILLPARAHIIAHEMLMKSYPNSNGLKHAYAQMALVENPYQSRRPSARQYELGRIARSNALKGISRPEWVKEKMRVKKSYTENYRKPKSKSHAENISKSLTGYKQTTEHTAKSAATRRTNAAKRNKLKTDKLRKDFIMSGLSRKEFAISIGMNYTTLKHYLTGL